MWIYKRQNSSSVHFCIEMGPVQNVFLIITFMFFSFNFFVGLPIENKSTLKLVVGVFRHGQKTNDQWNVYPKDPYANETYYPYGYGQLTNEGRRGEYSLGLKLYHRYLDFLGPVYEPDVIHAVSTQFPRCKASLQLVLAALWPPKGTLLNWNDDFNWQPIPYDYILPNESHILALPMQTCPNYVKAFDEFLKSKQGQEVGEQFAYNFDYIAQNAGINVTSISNLYLLASALVSEDEFGLILPEWTKRIYPDYITNALQEFFLMSTATPRLKQLTGGFLLKKIIADMSQKASNELLPAKRKIFLYSAHEYNVAFLLGAMNVYYPHIPVYGSCVLIELHEISGVYGVKIFYEDHSGPLPKPLKIPGCDYFCPLNKFEELLEQNLPENDDLCETTLN